MEKNFTFAGELADVLVQKKLITHQESREYQKLFERSDIDHFADFLLEQSLVDRDDLLEALGHYYGVPAVDVSDQFFETLLLHKFPEEFLVRNGVIPLEREENMLMVVAADPSSDEMVSELRGFVSYDIKCLVGLRQDIIDAIRQYYDTSLTEVPEAPTLEEEHRMEQDAERIMYGEDEKPFDEED